MNLKFIFFIVFSLFIFTNCSDSDKEDIYDEKQKDIRYYVKYEVYMGFVGSSWGPHSMGVSYTTENGEQHISTSDSKWEGTFGPIKKGTKLKISVRGTMVSQDTYNYVRLSVSRDKEPFVIKGEDRQKGASSLSVSYDL